jgi:flavin reductase (DIM6/NTAB) family NADH-FMN oxidoreductase RutF
MKLVQVDYAAQIPELMKYLEKPGLLLVVPDERRPANPMTIGWASFGRIWRLPMCTVLVRHSRYTFDLINKAGAFTVNLMPSENDKAVLRCGTASGRDVDKVAEQGWRTENGLVVPSPFLAEAALHIECRTVFTDEVDQSLDASLFTDCYGKGDLHRIYYGQVMGVYRHE